MSGESGRCFLIVLSFDCYCRSSTRIVILVAGFSYLYVANTESVDLGSAFRHLRPGVSSVCGVFHRVINACDAAVCLVSAGCLVSGESGRCSLICLGFDCYCRSSTRIVILVAGFSYLYVADSESFDRCRILRHLRPGLSAIGGVFHGVVNACDAAVCLVSSGCLVSGESGRCFLIVLSFDLYCRSSTRIVILITGFSYLYVANTESFDRCRILRHLRPCLSTVCGVFHGVINACDAAVLLIFA